MGAQRPDPRRAGDPWVARAGRWIRSDSFCHLHLVLLFTLLVVQPLRRFEVYEQFLAHVTLVAVMASGVVAVGRVRWRMPVAAALASPMLLLGFGTTAPSSGQAVVGLATGGLFMAFCSACLLIDLFRERRVEGGMISKALSAYIMLGLTWSFAYAMLSGVDPEAIRGLAPFDPGSASGRLGSFLYFSLITMTTVGYGDVTPVTDEARALVMLQALAGQIVLVVLVARLVGMQVATSMTSERGAGGDRPGG